MQTSDKALLHAKQNGKVTVVTIIQFSFGGSSFAQFNIGEELVQKAVWLMTLSLSLSRAWQYFLGGSVTRIYGSALTGVSA
jgi:hypothetical protein